MAGLPAIACEKQVRLPLEVPDLYGFDCRAAPYTRQRHAGRLQSRGDLVSVQVTAA